MPGILPRRGTHRKDEGIHVDEPSPKEVPSDAELGIGADDTHGIAPQEGGGKHHQPMTHDTQVSQCPAHVHALEAFPSTQLSVNYP